MSTVVSFVHFTTINLILRLFHEESIFFSMILKINYDFSPSLHSLRFYYLPQSVFPQYYNFLFMGIFNIHGYIQIMSNETSFPIKMSKEHLKNWLSSPLWRQLSLSFLFSTFHYSFNHSIILEKNFEYLWRFMRKTKHKPKNSWSVRWKKISDFQLLFSNSFSY